MIAFRNEVLSQDKIENHEEALAAETASLTLVEPGEAAGTMASAGIIALLLLDSTSHRLMP